MSHDTRKVRLHVTLPDRVQPRTEFIERDTCVCEIKAESELASQIRNDARTVLRKAGSGRTLGLEKAYYENCNHRGRQRGHGARQRLEQSGAPDYLRR